MNHQLDKQSATHCGITKVIVTFTGYHRDWSTFSRCQLSKAVGAAITNNIMAVAIRCTDPHPQTVSWLPVHVSADATCVCMIIHYLCALL